MATVSFRISDELKRELDALSVEKGFHLSKLFRMAIKDIRDTMRHGPAGGAFDLSLKERLSLANQYRILELLDKDGAERHRENREIIMIGQETHYPILLEHFNGAPSLDLICEVMDILEMFARLHLSANLLEDLDGIDPADLRFAGFSVDYENEWLNYTRFFVLKLGRYSWLCEDLNPALESVTPMADTYRRMLPIWQQHDPAKLLEKDQITEIAAARNGHAAPQAASAS